MRSLPLALLACIPLLAQTTPEPPLRPVPFAQVRVADRFFAPRRAVNTAVTLDHALRQLEATGTLGNFDLAGRGATTGHRGFVYQDSDAFKALEAVAYALADQRDPDLEARLDAVIERVAKAQQSDGYLNTAYTVDPRRGERFHNLRDDHELYCAGHLFEAAVAHFQATGKRTLLDVATRYADLLVRTFGPGDDRRAGYCGHPEIELALVKLARATDRQDYLDLAAWFVRQRGSRFFAREHGEDPQRYDGRYWLDHEPVAHMQGIAGHAVRAAYLMAGATDVAAARADQELLAAVHRVWHNTIEQNVFVTGGIGPSASNEGFTVDHDLPTHSAYQESCASIALVLWAHRLLLLTHDASYADAMERALYNAIPAGVQLDGRRFFYVNPLASHGSHHRREWFGCACCPPNLARTLAALGGFAYATGNSAFWVNLHVAGDVRTEIDGTPFAMTVTTDYPWAGDVELQIVEAAATPMTLHLRVPAWCAAATVRVANEPDRRFGPGWASLRRTWQPGERVHLSLPMPVQTLQADPRAEALRGMVAFQRGPIVYCLEQADHTAPVGELIAPPGTQPIATAAAALLGGVTLLHGTLLHAPAATWTSGGLYRPLPETTPVAATFVPYAVWDNRAAGAMTVFVPQAPPPPRVGGPELTATIELSFRNWNCEPEALRDGIDRSPDGRAPARNCHFWNHRGGTEHATYAWTAPQRLDGSRVHWFDDTGHGECRLPRAARLLWRDGDTWRPVEVTGDPLPITRDRACEVRFVPVTTTALRLEIDQPDGHASGILEWRVSTPR